MPACSTPKRDLYVIRTTHLSSTAVSPDHQEAGCHEAYYVQCMLKIAMCNTHTSFSPVSDPLHITNTRVNASN